MEKLVLHWYLPSIRRSKYRNRSIKPRNSIEEKSSLVDSRFSRDREIVMPRSSSIFIPYRRCWGYWSTSMLFQRGGWTEGPRLYRVDNAPTFRQGLWAVTSRIGKRDRNESFRINYGRIFPGVKTKFRILDARNFKLIVSLSGFRNSRKACPSSSNLKPKEKYREKKRKFRRVRKLIKKLKKILKK